MIRAVAADRNWDHNTHASLHRVIARLAKGTGDDSICRWFRSANALHQNFYDNWGDADYVAGGLRDVRDLLDRLEPLLDHQGTHPQATT